MRFIGEADEGTFLLIRTALAGIEAAAFELALEKIGHFPPARQPRVLWVGMKQSLQLLALQAKVEDVLEKSGVAPEERRFSPHITLARLKETPPQKVAAFEQRHAAFSSAPFPVTEFYLYSSTLSREGAVHKREATYHLTQATA